MSFYSNYYKHDVFISLSSADEGYFPHLTDQLSRSLKEAILARPEVACKRIKKTSITAEPSIHLTSLKDGNLPPGGSIVEVIANDALQSLIFIAYIGINYLQSEYCLTELHAFLNSRREKQCKKDSIFLILTDAIDRNDLFDLRRSQLQHLRRLGRNVEARVRYKKLYDEISKSLKELFKFPENLQIAGRVSTQQYLAYSGNDPAAPAKTLATNIALRVVHYIESSAALVDPEKADAGCIAGTVVPVVYVKTSPISRETNRAIELLEHLSTGGPTPIKRYSIPLDKLLWFVENKAANPYDPQLLVKPIGLFFTRAAAISFPTAQANLLRKLKGITGDDPTLEILMQMHQGSAQSCKGCAVTFITTGDTRQLDPESLAKKFVEQVQERHRQAFLAACPAA